MPQICACLSNLFEHKLVEGSKKYEDKESWNSLIVCDSVIEISCWEALVANMIFSSKLKIPKIFCLAFVDTEILALIHLLF